MKRVAILGVVCAAATARAEDRVELAHVPDLAVVEHAFPLDRHVPYEHRKRLGVTGSAALGIDSQGDTVATATAAIGEGSENVIAGLRGELIVGPDGIVRGRHRGLLELRSDWDDDLVGSLALSGRLDHGAARGLALPRLGVGKSVDGDVALDGMVRIGSDKGDFQWVAIARGEVGGTRWLDAPGLDRASRRAVTLGTVKTSFAGEIPRGSIDLLRGRVEHVRIRRPLALAGTGSIESELRIVELGLGTHELTFHIDHELLAVIAVDLGWSWLEADTSAGRLAESAFRMRLGTGIEWRDERSEFPLRRIGIGLGRVPTYTPDGQRLVSEWRLELDQGIETRRFVLGARGGVTFLSPIAGPDADTLVGYGVQLDAAIKLGGGIEAGAYHASTYQPRLAGDPWGSPRHWAIEAGVLARFRR
jgi:hypothetical protein